MDFFNILLEPTCKFSMGLETQPS